MRLDIPRRVIEDCPQDIGAAVSFLRGAGLSKVESIAALAQKFSLSLADAKATVHLSDAWSDRREADDAFHGALERMLEDGIEE